MRVLTPVNSGKDRAPGSRGLCLAHEQKERQRGRKDERRSEYGDERIPHKIIGLKGSKPTREQKHVVNY